MHHIDKTMNTDLSYREKVLRRFGASDAELIELLGYTEHTFNVDVHEEQVADEPFVHTWRLYMHEARETGAACVLADKLIQLRFPVEEGISGTQAYKSATRRGAWPHKDGAGMVFDAPDKMEIQIHKTPAGSIPLVITKHRADFVRLFQAIVKKNEPLPVPDSMGAAMIAGYNNWDRIGQYRKVWESESGTVSESAWQAAFKKLIPQKSLYQDRFILLSDGPYSGVTAADMELKEADWRNHSLIIRREHECAHYYTRRVFGSMRNNMLDELIADYMGIVAAIGHFRADWFLRFIGLEDFPIYRKGGRLENYRGDLSDGAFEVLKKLIYEAAWNLERHDPARFIEKGNTLQQKSKLLSILSRFRLEEFTEAEMLQGVTCSTY